MHAVFLVAALVAEKTGLIPFVRQHPQEPGFKEHASNTRVLCLLLKQLALVWKGAV